MWRSLCRRGNTPCHQARILNSQLSSNLIEQIHEGAHFREFLAGRPRDVAGFGGGGQRDESPYYAANSLSGDGGGGRVQDRGVDRARSGGSVRDGALLALEGSGLEDLDGEVEQLALVSVWGGERSVSLSVVFLVLLLSAPLLPPSLLHFRSPPVHSSPSASPSPTFLFAVCVVCMSTIGRPQSGI